MSFVSPLLLLASASSFSFLQFAKQDMLKEKILKLSFFTPFSSIILLSICNFLLLLKKCLQLLQSTISFFFSRAELGEGSCKFVFLRRSMERKSEIKCRGENRRAGMRGAEIFYVLRKNKLRMK